MGGRLQVEHPRSGGGWLALPSERPRGRSERVRSPPFALPPFPTLFGCLGSGGTRAEHDSPFTIDTIVVAGWPSPLRLRSLVSSTDSICLPRGCLITGRRVDHGREQESRRVERRARVLARETVFEATNARARGRASERAMEMGRGVETRRARA